MEDTTSLEAAWRGLLAEAAATAKEAAALKRTALALGRTEGYESLKKVQQALAKLENLERVPPSLLEAARAAATPVAAWLEGEWARRARDFVAEARAYFEARSVPLEGEGFRLRCAPIEVEVHASEDRAELLYADETLAARLPLVAERLFREREGALQRLQRGATAPDELADQVIEAYDQVLRLRDGRPGSRVRLPDVHFQLFVDRQTAQARQSLSANRIKEYPRAQFAFDLAGLLASPHFLVREGRTIYFVEAPPSLARSRSASIAVVAMNGTTTTLSDVRVG